MNYRSILIVCLATLELAVAGWGQTVTSSDGEAWVAGDIRRLTDASGDDWSPSWSPDSLHRFYLRPRRQQGDLRDGCEWRQSAKPNQ